MIRSGRESRGDELAWGPTHLTGNHVCRTRESRIWKVRDGGWGDSINWVAGDFNADGLADIVAIWDDGGTNTLTVRQSTGSSFVTQHWDIHDGGWMDQTRWVAGKFR